MTLHVDHEQIYYLASQFRAAVDTLNDGRRQASDGDPLPKQAVGDTGGAADFATIYNGVADTALDTVKALMAVLRSDDESLRVAALTYQRTDDDAAADLAVAGAHTLDIFTAHVHSGSGDSDDAERAKQIGRAWDVVGSNAGPTIFTGDLNDAIYRGDGSDPDRGDKHSLSADEIRRYEDLGFTNAAPGAPTSNDGTGRAIDYVFTGPDVATGRAEVVDGGPSDHQGIGVDVAVPHRWW